jgi:hypothetical protein
MLDGKRYAGYETGALARALDLPVDGRALRFDQGVSLTLDEGWTDVRTMRVIGVQGGVEVLLQRRLPDGSCRSYRTGLDGVLRSAALRQQEWGPLEKLSVDLERDRFSMELDAWRAEALAESDTQADPFPVADEELRVLSRRLDSPEGAAALDDALAALKARGVFVAEAMNDAPPHVVLRVVRATLRQLLP